MVTPRRPVSRARVRAPHPCGAFTLLEVIAVLILLGVLAAVVLPRVGDMGEDLTSSIELLKTRIRYAQMRSINNVSVHGVHSTGSSYWMFSGGDTANREPFPGMDSDTVTLPSGIGTTAFTVSFDNRGAPYSDAAASAGSELTSGSAAASITVGGKAGAVRITPGTGYVRD
ncbi:MAG: type II secretion system protein [Thermodesulfobacteriota bacterium]